MMRHFWNGLFTGLLWGSAFVVGGIVIGLAVAFGVRGITQ